MSSNFVLYAISAPARTHTARVFHRPFDKLQRCLAIPTLCGKDFEHLAFVIDGPPEVMCFTVDPHEHLVQMPAPLRV